jgi:ribonuclease Z
MFKSIYLDYNGEGILLDCGEGTQRQMQLANLNFNKIKKILISHWHGDHVAGLIGLLQTIGAFTETEKELKLFGPKGSKKFIENMLKSCVFDNAINLEVVELDCKELTTFYENSEYALQAINLEHSVPCIGFKFVKKEKLNISKQKLSKFGVKDGPHLVDLQKGKDITYEGKKILAKDVTTKTEEKSIAFIFDTKLCDACFDLAKDSTILVCEAVYAKNLEKKAEEYCHMTSYQAAQVANDSGCETLYLTHFSQRYKTIEELEADAKDIFDNTICAYDLLKVKFNF